MVGRNSSPALIARPNSAPSLWFQSINADFKKAVAYATTLACCPQTAVSVVDDSSSGMHNCLTVSSRSRGHRFQGNGREQTRTSFHDI